MRFDGWEEEKNDSEFSAKVHEEDEEQKGVYSSFSQTFISDSELCR